MTTTRITNPKDYVAGFRDGMKEHAAAFELAAMSLSISKFYGDDNTEIEDALKVLLMVFAKHSQRLASEYSDTSILGGVVVEEE